MTNTRDTLPIACTLTERELALRRDDITAMLREGTGRRRARTTRCVRVAPPRRRAVDNVGAHLSAHPSGDEC